jgi:hypothetical protein
VTAAHAPCRAALVVLGCSAALLGSGCLGSGDDGDQGGADRGGQRSADPGAETKAGRDRARSDSPPRTAPLQPAHCPPELTNCKTASGRIVYVERVDPDGDGDAHFVLTSREAITLPGLSVIDVKKSLRPHPLPTRGDRISAAGPVYRGSFGQKQIEAIELHVARAR